MKTPLYGHTSEATAYVVDDYPYGFRLRCKIRYWLEHHKTRGFRFVSQTTNPKRPGEPWNKPKASAYSAIAGCMYLDEQGHVHWHNVSEYTSAAQALEYVETFPGALSEELQMLARLRVRFYRQLAAREVVPTINGVEVPEREGERERNQAEAEAWAKVVALLPEKLQPTTSHSPG